VDAHPVPRRAHDRTIAVRLAADADNSRIIVNVAYRLEIDEFTVVFDDLPALGDKVELSKLRAPDEFYDAFTRCYAPILAANLLARLDGKPLEFVCIQKSHQLKDENGVPLNHLRCDFVFEARSPASAVRAFWPRPSVLVPLVLTDFLLAGTHTLTFREGNYELEEGYIRASLAAGGSIAFLGKTEPDAGLQARPAAELKPGDDARLRILRATFVMGDGAHAGEAKSVSPPPPLTLKTARSESPQAAASGLAKAGPPDQPVNTRSWWKWMQELSLRDLFRETQYGFWMLMLLALAVGGIHALTPGHGKTLVAAYLVGERGTVGHAFVLGLVTTLTHTGVVIAVAVALRLFVPEGRLTAAGQQNLQSMLEFGGGLLVVCLGFWLLLRRLAGQVDHFHLPGHGHHHPIQDHVHSHGHEHADHFHDEHGNARSLPHDGHSVSWWGLVVLGINGGIVPCWDAIVVLLLAVSTNRLWLALPMLLAFSAGLAGVLILVGIVVVRAKRLADPRWQGSRLSKLLPILSSLVVTLLGLWLCYDSFHVKAMSPADVLR